MKIYIALFISLIITNFANAQNTNITIDKNLNLTCAFEKVILKNPDHNFETFTKELVKENKKIKQIKNTLFIIRYYQIRELESLFLCILINIFCNFVNKLTCFNS